MSEREFKLDEMDINRHEFKPGDKVLVRVNADDPQPSQHTPGPWEFSQQDIGDEEFIYAPWRVNAKNGVIVVDGEGGLYSWEGQQILMTERFANARLIAAAPDLLAACEADQALLDWLDGQIGTPAIVAALERIGWKNGADGLERAEAFIGNYRRQAIAKARGQR